MMKKNIPYQKSTVKQCHGDTMDYINANNSIHENSMKRIQAMYSTEKKEADRFFSMRPRFKSK